MTTETFQEAETNNYSLRAMLAIEIVKSTHVNSKINSFPLNILTYFIQF